MEEAAVRQKPVSPSVMPSQWSMDAKAKPLSCGSVKFICLRGKIMKRWLKWPAKKKNAKKKSHAHGTKQNQPVCQHVQQLALPKHDTLIACE